MISILANIINFVKKNLDSIILFLMIFLLCLLSFGAGVIFEREIKKPPLRIEKING